MPKTYNDLYLETRRRLREADIAAFALEARLLCALAADKTPEKFMQEVQMYASDAVEQTLSDLTERRLRGEPAAYLTGSWGFYGLDFTITPAVLIPRMDTELLAHAALEELERLPAEARVLDLCAGSGCLGCTLAQRKPEIRVVLADVSEAALEVSRLNVARHALGERVRCLRCDALEPPGRELGSFDLIVSNPPYVPSGEISGLEASVRDYEPHLALDGGADGLDFYRAILKHWRGALRTGGALLLEVGEDQAPQVTTLMRLAGLRDIRSLRDTGNVERVVLGRA